ncbi:MAG TPA: hypothetical protein ENN63_03440 [Bacteroidetes bacterium]|nr:hypothetical protein [Bacteroidota bacterium]
MKKIVAMILIVFVLAAACKRNRLKVDISGIELELKIDRFERVLFSIPPDSLEEELPGLSKRYGRFLDRFSTVINIGLPGDPGYSEYLRFFVTDSMVREVYRTVENTFPDLSWHEEALENAFRHYLYYFPDRDVPEVYSYISGFNHSLIIDRGILGIGLDKYLGRDAEYYPMLGLPLYMRDRMEPQRIPFDGMYYWASTEFPFRDSVNNVLCNMVYQGQLLYFTEAMFPTEHDSLIIGYSPEQVEWVKENEGAMYTYLVENRLLFDQSSLTISKLVNDAPFTQYFSTESPGRTGAWLGWQIVRSYMKNHSGISLSELMADTDYQQIFTRSGYYP